MGHHSLEAINSGLEIFDSDMPWALSCHDDDPQFLVPPTEITMTLRHVALKGQFFRRDALLKGQLEAVDETFGEIASLSSATVPQHVWGLQYSPEAASDQCHGNPLVPTGYLLMLYTEVFDTVSDICEPHEHDTIWQGIGHHLLEGNSPAVWDDYGVRQFKNGTGRISKLRQKALLDLEPRMGQRLSKDVWLSQGFTTIDDVVKHVRQPEL